MDNRAKTNGIQIKTDENNISSYEIQNHMVFFRYLEKEKTIAYFNLRGIPISDVEKTQITNHLFKPNLDSNLPVTFLNMTSVYMAREMGATLDFGKKPALDEASARKNLTETAILEAKQVRITETHASFFNKDKQPEQPTVAPTHGPARKRN